MSSTPSSTEAKPVEQSNKDLERSDAGIMVEEDPTFPDGGMKAWMTVCGAFFMQITAGYLFAVGVYQDFFVESFLSNFSVSQISWIGSVSTFITFTLGFFTGGLFDAGFFRFLITFGSLLVVFSLFMLSLTQAQHYYQVFLSLGIGYGLGDGMIYVPTIAVISHWFQRRRALAMGIATSGFSIGATFHPIMLNNLFHGSIGFANGVRASAGLFAGCLLIGSLLMRSRLPPAQHDISIPALLAKFARDLPYVGVCLALVAYTSGGLFPPFYLQLDSDSRGLSQTFGFYSLAIMNGSGFFGRLASGPLADTFGVFNALCFTAISSSALIFGLLGVKSVAGVVVFAVLFGFFLNAYIALLSPLFASFATDPSEIGARIGIGYTFIGLGSLIGTPITGALLSRRFTWWRPIVYSGTVTMVATGVYIVCRFAVSKRRATWKV